MDLKTRFSATLVCLMALVYATGCNREPEPADGTGEVAELNGPASHDDHEGHEHEHEHSHMGIHGGHVVVLEPGHIHAEWVHVEEDEMLEVYVLDNPDAVNSVRVVTQIAGQEPEEHELQPAADQLGKGGYQIQNPNLLTSIDMADGETNTVTLVVETDGGTMKSELGGSDDHDHDHDH